MGASLSWVGICMHCPPGPVLIMFFFLLLQSANLNLLLWGKQEDEEKKRRLLTFRKFRGSVWISTKTFSVPRNSLNWQNCSESQENYLAHRIRALLCAQKAELKLWVGESEKVGRGRGMGGRAWYQPRINIRLLFSFLISKPFASHSSQITYPLPGHPVPA